MNHTSLANRPLLIFVALACVLGPAASHLMAQEQEEYELRGGEFIKLQAPLPASPSGELAAIRKALADDEPKLAYKLAKKWIKANPNHPELAYAYVLRGDAQVMRGNLYKSLFDYELVARAYPGSPVFDTVLEREFEVAKAFTNGMKRKFAGIRFLDASAEAEEILIRIQERAPGSRIAERAGKELADFYFRDGQMLLAAEAYSIFLDNYPRSQWAEYAYERQITASLATFKGPRFDATGLYTAERKSVEFQEAFPGAAEALGTDETLVRIDESLAGKTLRTAQWYDRTDRKISAAYLYSRVVSDHPDSDAAGEAMTRLTELDPALADHVASQSPRLRPKGLPDVPLRPDSGEEPKVEIEAPVVPTPDLLEPEPQ